MRNANTLWASHPAAQLSLPCTSLYVSVLLINLLWRQKSRKPCLAPSQLVIHTQLEKLELSDIIYIIKSRARIEGKVYVKASKVALINVQSHQAWCIHLRSTTESSPWEAHCVWGKTQHTAGQGLQALQRGCPSSSTPQSRAVGCSPTQAHWDFQIPSAGLFSRPLIALPTWHIPCNTPLFLSTSYSC